MQILLYITIVIIYVFRTLASSIHQIHIVQANNYKARQYFTWIVKNPYIFLSKDELIFLSLEILIFIVKFTKFSIIIEVILMLAFIFTNVYILFIDAKNESCCEKTPLVVTRDVEISLGISMSIICSLPILIYILINNLVFVVLVLLAIDILTPFYILLCRLIIDALSKD